MKKITFVFLVTALISTFLLASNAMAWRCGAGRGMGGGGWGCGMGPGICWSYGIPNLTAEQSTKLTDLQKKHIEETSKLRSELAVKRIELDQLLTKSQPNPEEVLAKQNELTQLQSQLQQKYLNNQLKMRNTFSAEQISQLSYGFTPGAYPSPGWMRDYGPPQGQGFGPGRGRGYWGNRWGCGRSWW